MKITAFVVLTFLTASVLGAERSPAGMWNDGLVGENTSIYLASDGSGDFISMGSQSLYWSYDAALHIVTVRWQRPGQEKEEHSMRFRYDLEQQVLTALDVKRGEFEWRFKRLNQSFIDTWLKSKRENARDSK
jgi:hypothetical protein